eukprot:CAMPEP_0196571234 /NCGR_PEP_ID=MMETSP1081-20130531/1414_1 /TAXON_ID=36882 /ORGANISM="Pyramimonas amylifera, Strain CCMP720" /LENGTH=510 /DNA_ID=CAMNT_0041888091 /DNA_START=75 /DNA_END=1607 /DNA_ORIENTATION=-
MSGSNLVYVTHSADQRELMKYKKDLVRKGSEDYLVLAREVVGLPLWQSGCVVRGGGLREVHHTPDSVTIELLLHIPARTPSSPRDWYSHIFNQNIDAPTVPLSVKAVCHPKTTVHRLMSHSVGVTLRESLKRRLLELNYAETLKEGIQRAESDTEGIHVSIEVLQRSSHGISDVSVDGEKDSKSFVPVPPPKDLASMTEKEMQAWSTESTTALWQAWKQQTPSIQTNGSKNFSNMLQRVGKSRVVPQFPERVTSAITSTGNVESNAIVVHNSGGAIEAEARTNHVVKSVPTLLDLAKQNEALLKMLEEMKLEATKPQDVWQAGSTVGCDCLVYSILQKLGRDEEVSEEVVAQVASQIRGDLRLQVKPGEFMKAELAFEIVALGGPLLQISDYDDFAVVFFDADENLGEVPWKVFGCEESAKYLIRILHLGRLRFVPLWPCDSGAPGGVGQDYEIYPGELMTRYSDLAKKIRIPAFHAPVEPSEDQGNEMLALMDKVDLASISNSSIPHLE